MEPRFPHHGTLVQGEGANPSWVSLTCICLFFGFLSLSLFFSFSVPFSHSHSATDDGLKIPVRKFWQFFVIVLYIVSPLRNTMSTKTIPYFFFTPFFSFFRCVLVSLRESLSMGTDSVSPFFCRSVCLSVHGSHFRKRGKTEIYGQTEAIVQSGIHAMHSKKS